jgi:hypothetical protein
MFHKYTIYYKGKFFGVVPRAVSENDAVTQVWMKNGSASKYSGPSFSDFSAKRS